VAVEIAAEDKRSKFIQVIEKLLVQENICRSFPPRRYININNMQWPVEDFNFDK